MNRAVISHRSVRGIRLSGQRVVLMIATAAIFSLGLAFFRDPLLEVHQSLCRRIVELVDVPILASAAVEGGIPAELVNIPAFAGNRVGMIIAGIATLILVILHRVFPMARSFIFFIVALLAISLLLGIFNPEFHVNSGPFIQLWLGTQFWLWVVLPWVCALLVMPIEPSPWRSIGWILAIGVYGFFWSSIRLAFCLGVLHYTGLLFLTVLWFGFGPLADLLYILVFYSLAVRHASLKVWGQRCAT